MKKEDPNVAKWMSQIGGNQKGLAKLLYFLPEPKKIIMAKLRVNGMPIPIAKDLRARLALEFFDSVVDFLGAMVMRFFWRKEESEEGGAKTSLIRRIYW